MRRDVPVPTPPSPNPRTRAVMEMLGSIHKAWTKTSLQMWEKRSCGNYQGISGGAFCEAVSTAEAHCISSKM